MTLVINDRVDIALALGPDVGVHVGQSDLPIHLVRLIWRLKGSALQPCI